MIELQDEQGEELDIDTLVCKGWLYKKQKGIKGVLNKVFFSLTRGKLCEFEDLGIGRTGFKTLRVRRAWEIKDVAVNLSRAAFVKWLSRTSEEEEDPNFVVEMVVRGGRFVVQLYASTWEESTQWMAAANACMEHYRNVLAEPAILWSGWVSKCHPVGLNGDESKRKDYFLILWGGGNPRLAWYYDVATDFPRGELPAHNITTEPMIRELEPDEMMPGVPKNEYRIILRHDANGKVRFIQVPDKRSIDMFLQSLSTLQLAIDPMKKDREEEKKKKEQNGIEKRKIVHQGYVFIHQMDDAHNPRKKTVSYDDAYFTTVAHGRMTLITKEEEDNLLLTIDLHPVLTVKKEQNLELDEYYIKVTDKRNHRSVFKVESLSEQARWVQSIQQAVVRNVRVDEVRDREQAASISRQSPDEVSQSQSISPSERSGMGWMRRSMSKMKQLKNKLNGTHKHKSDSESKSPVRKAAAEPSPAKALAVIHLSDDEGDDQVKGTADAVALQRIEDDADDIEERRQRMQLRSSRDESEEESESSDDEVYEPEPDDGEDPGSSPKAGGSSPRQTTRTRTGPKGAEQPPVMLSTTGVPMHGGAVPVADPMALFFEACDMVNPPLRDPVQDFFQACDGISRGAAADYDDIEYDARAAQVPQPKEAKDDDEEHNYGGHLLRKIGNSIKEFPSTLHADNLSKIGQEYEERLPTPSTPGSSGGGTPSEAARPGLPARSLKTNEIHFFPPAKNYQEKALEVEIPDDQGHVKQDKEVKKAQKLLKAPKELHFWDSAKSPDDEKKAEQVHKLKQKGYDVVDSPGGKVSVVPNPKVSPTARRVEINDQTDQESMPEDDGQWLSPRGDGPGRSPMVPGGQPVHANSNRDLSLREQVALQDTARYITISTSDPASSLSLREQLERSQRGSDNPMRLHNNDMFEDE